MTHKRKTEIINNCLGYLTELISDEEELSRVLTKTIGLTPEELHEFGVSFLKDELNSMCLNCECLNSTCEGTTEKMWTGCVFRRVINS